jgi:hypothetical protein
MDRGHRPLVRRPSTATPARAHGVVRVINERHEQEERLAYLSRFDAPHRRDESLASHRGA